MGDGRSSDGQGKWVILGGGPGPPGPREATDAQDGLEKGGSKAVGPRQGLLRRPHADQVTHQEREVGARGLEEVELSDILPEVTPIPGPVIS
jgi:hypothetical protein